ncbi:MAG: HIT family protein [Deltaproteobacteria bacterium]|nr:MAG: HIT family protein [Deltaproteobacteria bacterium]
MENCIFCQIITGRIPSVKVYEDDRVFAFEDINPISEGHTLIIPKTHAENLFEMTGADLSAVIHASKKVASGIQKALSPDGIAMLQLNGRGANQVVMHYHMHLVPRMPGAGRLPITIWEIKAGDMDAIQKTGAKIAAAIE